MENSWHDNFLIKEILNKNKNIKIIEQNDLAECLSKTSLVVSDFSSVIFDLMYRGKPFVMYIPDGDEPNLNRIYSNDCVDLIQRMNNSAFKCSRK